MGMYKLGDTVHFVKESGNSASLSKEEYKIIHIFDGEKEFLIVSKSDIDKAKLSDVLNGEVDLILETQLLKHRNQILCTIMR